VIAVAISDYAPGIRDATINSLYFGPPPPSGTVHLISCVGVLIEQVLHYARPIS
jgi:hypothetical protein